MRNVFMFNRCSNLPSALFCHPMHWMRAWLLVAMLATASCSSTPPSASTYTVKRGDTLYAIATRFGVDYRELARLNRIGRDYKIHPGQVLRLTVNARVPIASSRPAVRPPKATPRTMPLPPSIPWRWPVEGGLATVTERPNGGHGLTISGTLGQAVHAASGGRVVYLGSGLLGYGQLLIIKHNDAYLSAYGHTQSVSVKEGGQSAGS